jgi:hypothetical protein
MLKQEAYEKVSEVFGTIVGVATMMGMVDLKEVEGAEEPVAYKKFSDEVDVNGIITNAYHTITWETVNINSFRTIRIEYIGLTSGLISEDMFSRGYRYYYGNCSRILPAEAGVSRSIQIVGQNASSVIIDLLVFVEFEKEITIDITTGARIE